ncbi:MAG: glycosyltransferase family 4 protein [Chloroflexi bacterium]|nr:glycosyltransferase family 4 protein [Chloroflexota bacterium]
MTDRALLHVLMIASEFRLHKVGGLGSHVVALAPRLADVLALHLVVPQFERLGAAEESLGRYGRLYRVDAQHPQAGETFDHQVWEMNDRLNEFIRGQLLPRQHYDVLHVHDWLSGYVANDLHRNFGLPLVITIHATEHGRMNGRVSANPLSQRIHLAETYLAQHADKIIACSEFMRQEISHALAVPAQKIAVVPNGVDIMPALRQTRHDPALQAWRRQWVAADAPMLFFVGRLVGDKGPDLLLAAMPEILQHFPDAKAVLAGKGPFDEHLRRLIDQLDLAAHVVLPGFISDADRQRFYAAADVAVFPSRYEPFGIVALEAMVAGVPVVVTKVGGLQEVVEHGVTGWCVEPGRADTLASGILQVLHHPHEAQRRAETARQHVMARYGWDRVAQQTIAVYESLLAS